MTNRLTLVATFMIVLAGSAPAAADDKSVCLDASAEAEQVTASCTGVIEAGKESPEDLATALVARGDAYRKGEAYDDAIADYTRAIELAPGNAAPYVNRGLAWHTMGEGENALADLGAALTLVPADDPGHDKIKGLIASVEEQIAAGGWVMGLGFGNEVLTVVVPLGFTVGYSDARAGLLVEFVPVGQTVETWSEIFTISAFGHTPGRIADLRERLQAGFFETCSGGKGTAADEPITNENGFPVAVWVQSCALTISGPSQGKPEADIFKFIQGKERDVALMVGFRYQPTADEVARWKAFLGKTTLRPK